MLVAARIMNRFMELARLHAQGHCSLCLIVPLPETGPRACRGAGLRKLAWLPVQGGYWPSCLHVPLPATGLKQPVQTGSTTCAGRPLVFLASEVPRRSERDLAKFRRRRPNNLSGDVLSLDALMQVCGSCSCIVQTISVLQRVATACSIKTSLVDSASWAALVCTAQTARLKCTMCLCLLGPVLTAISACSLTIRLGSR